MVYANYKVHDYLWLDVKNLHKYGLAVIRSKKLLVVREHNTSIYLLPGGKPEDGEDMEKTLIREIKEELNADLLLSSIRNYGIFEDIAANESNTIIKITLAIGDVKGDLKPSSEIEEIRWIGSDNQLNLAPSIKNKILPALIKDGIVE